MKDKTKVYIEKMKPLLEKLKPWLKTKRAWVQIGLSIVAVICLILAGVSSCSRRNVAEDNVTSETLTTPKPTESATADPAATVTPTAAATPSNTASSSNSEGSSSDTDSNSEGEDPKVPENDISSSSNIGPTGAPLYTPVPAESVSTKARAYSTLVESCKASVDYSGYYLYDMDADGVEELILHYGADDTEALIDIYTFTEDGLVFVGDCSGCFATVSGSTEAGIIVYYRREINGQKHESIERMVKTGDSMYSDSVVPQAKVSEYTVLEDSVDIPRYKINDLSPIQ